MATALRPVAHEDRLSLVEHLDELRTRILLCLAVFAVAFGVCFWQNDAILGVLDPPFQQAVYKQGQASQDPFEQTADWQRQSRQSMLALAAAARVLARDATDPETRRLLQQVVETSRATAAVTPDGVPRRPVTLGVGEPFTVTLKVASYGALLLSLPILLYQAYAFVLPAFSPRERQVALPLMLAIPLLFIGGVIFAYAVVLPRAIDFLQNFNDDNFDILLQAQDYYRFSIMLLIVMGLLFQIPVGILAATRMGIISVDQLRRHRRYAILVVAVLAMLLPGTDPITMLVAMMPLIALYEGSILFAAVLDRRSRRIRDSEPDPDDDSDWDDEEDGAADEDLAAAWSSSDDRTHD